MDRNLPRVFVALAAFLSLGGMAQAQGVTIRAEVTYGESQGGNQTLWNTTGWALNLAVDPSSDEVEVRSPNGTFTASQTGNSGIFATSFSTVRDEVTSGDWTVTYGFEDPEPTNQSVFTFTVNADADFADELPLPADYPAFVIGGIQPGDTDAPLNPTFVWSGDSSGYDSVRFTLFPLVGGTVIGATFDLGMQSDPGIYTVSAADTLAPGTEYFAEVAFVRSVGFLTASAPAYLSGPMTTLPESLLILGAESFATRQSFVTTAIPEPATCAALLGLGAFVVAGRRRRSASR